MRVDKTGLVVTPALVELIIPLGVEEEIFALLGLPGLAQLEQLHVSELVVLLAQGVELLLPGHGVPPGVGPTLRQVLDVEILQ